MKLTKAQVTQLIKEEMSKVLKEADSATLQKDLMDAVNIIVKAYEGAELPPSIGELKEMIEAGQLLQAHHEITDKWNELILFHRESGRELLPIVWKTFGAVNNLLKNVPDSIGGQVGQRTPQRPADRDKDGNRIAVHEVKGNLTMKVTKTQLRRIIKEELNKALRNEAREDHIGDIEGRLDKSRRRAGNLEPGGYKQRELARRKMMRDDPFDFMSVSPDDEEAYDELTRKEKDYIDDKSMTSLNPDQERERQDLLNKIARLEKELARLKSA